MSLCYQQLATVALRERQSCNEKAEKNIKVLVLDKITGKHFLGVHSRGSTGQPFPHNIHREP